MSWNNPLIYELIDEHLYVGTSAGEILHHMRFPPDPSDPSGQPSYILASRLKPPVNQPGDAGIQQILLLPSVSKACVVSNGTLSFYSLPELSPAFPRVNPLTCGWVGGVDLDANQDELQDGVVVMLCLRGKIRLVKVGEEPLILRNIEFRGCLSIVRRGNFACLADARSYALLDVAQQQKIPLPSISSVDNQPAENAGNVPDDVWTTGSGNISRSLSPAEGFRMQEERGHRKTSSLGIFRKDNDSPGPSHLKPSSSQRHGFDSPALRRTSLGSRRVSTPDIASDIQKAELGKPLPPPPPTDSGSRTGSPAPNKDFIPLKPLIASPTAQEFLLVTGTAPNEPSLGVFVNLDGEVDRGTIEFPSYPESLVVDDKGFDMTNSQTIEEVPEEGHVLAVVQRDVSGRTVLDVQIQRYPGEGAGAKEWLGVSAMHESSSGTGNEQIGIRAIPHKAEVGVPEITEKLALKPIHIDLDDGNESKTLDDSTNRREKEEKDCIQRLCQVEARLTLWRGDEVFWLIRNPTVLRLDSRLRLAQATSVQRDAPIAPQRELIERIFNDIRDVRSATELEFLSLSYIRQKAATLLFMDLLIRTISGTIVFEHEKQYTERTLIESELDPRIVLAFLPTIREEILQGEGGIWLQGGLKEIVESFMAQKDMAVMPTDPNGPFGDNLLQVVKRFLLYWRRKKGNPSVKDGAQVFPTVDAALLHILLLLDSQSPPGPATAGSLRAELYAVVDNGVEGNERAIALLEGFKRLYVLSRHYGKRKMPTMVLQTWKRIISGEEDTGGEFIDGEMELRKYLSKLRDRTLVVEYGTWLAARNPKLGVQVFADENSKVVIPASEALAILREKAPNAVKEYLEYLVFGKKVIYLLSLHQTLLMSISNRNTSTNSLHITSILY